MSETSAADTPIPAAEEAPQTPQPQQQTPQKSKKVKTTILQKACEETLGQSFDFTRLFTLQHEEFQSLIQALISLIHEHAKRLEKLETSNGTKVNRNEFSQFHFEIQSCLRQKDLSGLKTELTTLFSTTEERVSKVHQICRVLEKDMMHRLMAVEDRSIKNDISMRNKVDRESVNGLKDMVREVAEGLEKKIDKEDALILIQSRFDQLSSTVERHSVETAAKLVSKVERSELDPIHFRMEELQTSLDAKADKEVVQAGFQGANVRMTHISENVDFNVVPKIEQINTSIEVLRKNLQNKAEAIAVRANKKQIDVLMDGMSAKADKVLVLEDLKSVQNRLASAIEQARNDLTQEVNHVGGKISGAVGAERQMREKALKEVEGALLKHGEWTIAEISQVMAALKDKANAGVIERLQESHQSALQVIAEQQQIITRLEEKVQKLQSAKADTMLVEEKADMRYCEEVFLRFGQEFDKAQTEMTQLTAQMKDLVSSVAYTSSKLRAPQDAKKARGSTIGLGGVGNGNGGLGGMGGPSLLSATSIGTGGATIGDGDHCLSCNRPIKTATPMQPPAMSIQQQLYKTGQHHPLNTSKQNDSLAVNGGAVVPNIHSLHQQQQQAGATPAKQERPKTAPASREQKNETTGEPYAIVPAPDSPHEKRHDAASQSSNNDTSNFESGSASYIDNSHLLDFADDALSSTLGGTGGVPWAPKNLMQGSDGQFYRTSPTKKMMIQIRPASANSNNNSPSHLQLQQQSPTRPDSPPLMTSFNIGELPRSVSKLANRKQRPQSASVASSSNLINSLNGVSPLKAAEDFVAGNDGKLYRNAPVARTNAFVARTLGAPRIPGPIPNGTAPTTAAIPTNNPSLSKLQQAQMFQVSLHGTSTGEIKPGRLPRPASAPPEKKKSNNNSGNHAVDEANLLVADSMTTAMDDSSSLLDLSGRK